MLSRFKTTVIVYLILLIGLIGLIVWLLNKGNNYPLALIAGLLALTVIISLFGVINSTNKKLADFLLNIKYDDFEAHYPGYKDPSEAQLSQAFNLITNKFRDIRSQKEAQFHYLNNIVEHVDTGLICFDEEGNTLMMNPALKRLLHKSYVPNLRSLEKLDVNLFLTLNRLGGGQKAIVKMNAGQETLNLNIRKSIMSIGNQAYNLFAIQNIRSELDAHEISAWQKLIRILTHEIINSVTPVASLASTLDHMLREKRDFEVETRQEFQLAIQTIQKRSESLIDFTRKFRSLATIPSPHFAEINLGDLVQRCYILISPITQEKSIIFHKSIPPQSLLVQADEGLLEQALINLLVNAVEALEGIPKGEITLATGKNKMGSYISVRDNGSGIPPELIDQIFVPFFTTKSNGSGIGLSLSRQIVLMHGGNIVVHSSPETGTEFVISL